MAGIMHLSERDAAIYTLVSEDTWEGHVEAPTGAFTGVTITNDTRLTQMPGAPAEVIGHWLVMEDTFGFVHVVGHDTQRSLTSAVSTLSVEFARWDAQ